MRKLILLAAIVCCSVAVTAQSENRYASQWEEIDSLIVLKNLPKTALEKVNLLYADAKVKQVEDEIIKALLYKLSLADKVEENDINKQISVLQQELKTTKDTISKSILSVLFANRLHEYYRQNFWKINRREETDSKEADITTWSNNQLLQTIDSLYASALLPKQLLQRTTTRVIDAILIKGNTPNTRPTVYDLVSHDALNYYKTDLNYVINPAYSFTLSNEHVLANAAQFMQYKFITKDTASHLLKTLQLFQQLLKFHLTDADPSAFIDVNIDRIEWVYNRTNVGNKEQFYRNALLDIINKFTNTKIATEAWYALAKLEADKASLYQPFTDTTDRYGYVKAKQLIDERLKAIPDSCFGNDEMKSLSLMITKPELSTVAEFVNVADIPFRLLINYKTIDTLYARVLEQKEVDKATKKQDNDRWKKLALITPVTSFQQALPQTNDYQSHAVEIKMDALLVGNYTILFSNSKNFDDKKDKLAAQPIMVSNLAYMRNNLDYFVVDRETGQPLSNVKVNGTTYLRNEKNNGRHQERLKTLYTDSRGHISLPDAKKVNQEYGNVNLVFQKGKDVLESNDYLYSYRYSYNNDDKENDSDYENDNSRVYFFTDRSIYRPGQTVFFKGIVTTKDRKTKQEKLYHYTDSIEVNLRDANGKQIDSMFVRMNEYGSFAGKFMLPQNALNGEFSIETIDFDGKTEFNVEEYKRPTFYIEFDTLKSSYRLKDTIVVTGYVKSYAGSSVDNANISYNIQRTANFPYSYLFWRTSKPYSQQTQIADSTVHTDANGMFTIRFVAMPDSLVEKQTEPLFNFKIELSATDTNGETRDHATSIKVGYQSMVVQASIPAIADVNNFRNIFITTKNNADENIPAKVNLVVKPLKTPSKAYRERLWPRPDQYVMSKEIYESYFPYDTYRDETDYHGWKKEEAVINDTFNTNYTSDYKLPPSLKQGWYCITVSAKDKYGDTIKDVHYIQLYDPSAPGLPSPQVNFSQNISNAGSPGDKAQWLFGTSEHNIFAIEKISSNSINSADSFHDIQLDSNKKQLEYSIQSTDHDNIGMYYAFIKHNRFYTGGTQVYINNEVKDLNINYASFRNKTEPVSKETWTVQVNDSKGEKADAELLTSMYDASLDQFKKQEWQLPYSGNGSDINNEWVVNTFNTIRGDKNWNEDQFYTPQKEYDHTAKSAEELLQKYEIEGINKENIAKFTPPKIVGDQEVKIRLSGRVMGVSVSADSAPMALNHLGTSSALNEVVVVGYGIQKKEDLTGSVTVLKTQSLSDSSFFKTKIRGITSTTNLNDILILIDGIITDKKIDALDVSTFDNVLILKGSEATALYGAKAANGAIVVTTKEFALRNNKKQDEQPQVQTRKNFNETAFFYPQLHVDSSGNYSFSFTMPEALTTWKWMSLAHTKQFAFGLREQNIITQKTLMVQPNLPRFLRQKDIIDLTAKITNLSDSILKGKTTLQLSDAINGQLVNDAFGITNVTQNFTADAHRSTIVKFLMVVPHNFDHPLTVKVIANAGNYSDGEERILPILSDRILVTEALPLYMQGQGSKQFTFGKLLHNKSSTLTNENLTVEYTTNPIWHVVQSLPYLIQFPHECAEQLFNRFYANTLGFYILSQNPQIKNVIDKWKNDFTALQGNLEKDKELKQIVLNETPWVTDAESEKEQKRNIALLFDSIKMNNSLSSALQQLKGMQKSSGAFAWFSGGYDDRYITQYILTGIGKLKKLNAIPVKQKSALNEIESDALSYTDREAAKEYDALIKNKADLTKNHLSPLQIQYWYMRSFFGTDHSKSISTNVLQFYIQQATQFWMNQTPYMQGMIAISIHRLLALTKPLSGLKNTPLDIIRSLKENAFDDPIKGMYWKRNASGYYWYQSPIEAQSLLIDVFHEITPIDTAVNAMYKWLIINKQTNNWGTTKATADACYILLSNNNMDTSENLAVAIRLGDSIVGTEHELQQGGSSYIKHRMGGNDIQTSMGKISVSVSGPATKGSNQTPSYGAVYWQYFEDINKITSASTASLSISKKLFVERNSDKGKTLAMVTDKDTLKVGDKVVIRLILKTDRNMEYIYIKDLRAAAMEPVNSLSGYKWQDGFGYYESTKDAATNFFMDHLTKGTYVIEYPVYITHTGNFSAGLANAQCMYAPEFTTISENVNIHVLMND